MLAAEAVFEFIDFEIDDLAQRRFVERAEDHKAIESVDELGLEVFIDSFFDCSLEDFGIGSGLLDAEADFAGFAEEVGAEV